MFDVKSRGGLHLISTNTPSIRQVSDRAFIITCFERFIYEYWQRPVILLFSDDIFTKKKFTPSKQNSLMQMPDTRLASSNFTFLLVTIQNDLINIHLVYLHTVNERTLIWKKSMDIRWIKVHSFFLLWTTSEKLFSVPLQDNRPPVDQEKKIKISKGIWKSGNEQMFGSAVIFI